MKQRDCVRSAVRGSRRVSSPNCDGCRLYRLFNLLGSNRSHSASSIGSPLRSVRGRHATTALATCAMIPRIVAAIAFPHENRTTTGAISSIAFPALSRSCFFISSRFRSWLIGRFSTVRFRSICTAPVSASARFHVIREALLLKAFVLILSQKYILREFSLDDT